MGRHPLLTKVTKPTVILQGQCERTTVSYSKLKHWLAWSAAWPLKWPHLMHGHHFSTNTNKNASTQSKGVQLVTDIQNKDFIQVQSTFSRQGSRIHFGHLPDKWLWSGSCSLKWKILLPTCRVGLKITSNTQQAFNIGPALGRHSGHSQSHCCYFQTYYYQQYLPKENYEARLSMQIIVFWIRYKKHLKT